MADEKEENSTSLNEFFYTWHIENVNLLWYKTGEKLKSPSFEVDWLSKSFSLCLYPKGTEDNEDYISYFLTAKDQVSMVNKEFKIGLYLLAVGGVKVEPESSDGFHSMKKHGMLGCPRFMSWETLKNKKSDYIPDEILTVCCKIWSKVKPDLKGNKPNEVKAYVDQSFARTQIKKEVIAKQMVIDNIEPKRQKIGEIKTILQDHPIATFYASSSEILGHKNLIIDIDVKNINIIKMAIVELMLIDEKRRRIFWMNTYSWNDFTEICLVLSSHFHQDSEQYVPQKMFDEKFLFLACQFTFTTGIVVQKREKNDYGNNLNNLLPLYFPSFETKTVPCPTLKDALLSMYEDDFYCDVELKNGTKSFSAHKIVLCSRSTKFEALQRSQDKTISPQIIHVEEDSDTLAGMLDFLYTGKISEMNWQIAKTMYSAAIKYAIDLLKHKCCDFINANLDESNVVEILLLAKEHNDIEMITSARNFIMENRTAVYSSVEWNNFRKSHSNFAVEVMRPKFQSNYFFRV